MCRIRLAVWILPDFDQGSALQLATSRQLQSTSLKSPFQTLFRRHGEDLLSVPGCCPSETPDGVKVLVTMRARLSSLSLAIRMRKRDFS